MSLAIVPPSCLECTRQKLQCSLVGGGLLLPEPRRKAELHASGRPAPCGVLASAGGTSHSSLRSEMMPSDFGISVDMHSHTPRLSNFVWISRIRQPQFLLPVANGEIANRAARFRQRGRPCYNEKPRTCQNFAPHLDGTSGIRCSWRAATPGGAARIPVPAPDWQSLVHDTVPSSFLSSRTLFASW